MASTERERVVEAAREAVAALGVRGATIRGVADRAGVSTGAVMHYFTDKASLHAAVLDANNQAAGGRVTRAMAGQFGLRALRAAVEALLPVDPAGRLIWRVWVAFWSESGDRPPDGLVVGHDLFAEILTRPMEDAVVAGELPNGIDLGYEAERLMTLAAGLGLGAVGAPTPRAKRLALRMLDDHLAHLAAKPEPAY